MLKSELRETKCDNQVKRIPSPHLMDTKECESGKTAALHNGSQLPHPYNDKTVTSQPWTEQAGVTVLSQLGIRRKKKQCEIEKMLNYKVIYHSISHQ